jgi:hypothetical protein
LGGSFSFLFKRNHPKNPKWFLLKEKEKQYMVSDMHMNLWCPFVPPPPTWNGNRFKIQKEGGGKSSECLQRGFQ